ncbi:restriction endonuclease subunit S [Yersinia enterocolitica]|nr:type I restriction endonuclease subunit S [Yersinia enterocolitica]ELI8399403.1 restriction endonuclease subunit S [Yersinia enterocolitica]
MNETILPEGWSNCTFADIAEVNPKKIKAEQNLNAGFIPMSHAPMNYNGKLEFEEKTWSEIGKSYTNFKNDDVIFAKVTPCFENGKAAIVKNMPNGIGAGSSEFYVLRARNKEIPANYLLGVIKTKKFMQEGAENMTGAVGLRRVPKAFVESFPLILPPVAEQKVIVEKLDTLLTQVDSTKERLEQIPQILKRFRQSVLSAAVSGKLTEEWRETQDVAESAEQLFDRWLSNRESNFENSKNKATEKRQTRPNKKFKIPIGPDIEKGKKIEIPSSWKLISVSQFSDCLDNQRIPIRKEDRNVSKGLYPYFGANGEVDKVDNYIFDGDFVLVTEDETFYGREKPIAYRYSGKCWVNNHAHVLSAQTKEANDFLCYTLMYYDVIPWLTGTTGRAKLTQGALNVLPIGLPSEIEILEIVRRVEQLFTYADTIEKQVQSALLRVNNLTQSILAKAFRGELTAQWRAENPDLINGGNSAEALLVRIKQERLKNKPVKRGKGNS